MLQPASSARSRRAQFISWPKWLGVQFLAGVILIAVITLVMRPLLEGWEVRALGQGTMFMACFVDWSRWREFRWRPFLVLAALVYGVSFAVWYLFPD
jgi:hypothetical protein